MASKPRGIIGWLVRHKGRIGTIAASHAAKYWIGWVFNYLIYGAVVVYCVTTWGAILGSLVAFVVMTPLAGALCYIYFVVYDRVRADMLGIEALKSLREEQPGESWFSRHLHRIARQGDIPAFIVLSIFGDAFLVTAYLRKGVGTYTLTRRDWYIFWSSNALANAYWTLRLTVIVWLALLLWEWATTLI